MQSWNAKDGIYHQWKCMILLGKRSLFLRFMLFVHCIKDVQTVPSIANLPVGTTIVLQDENNSIQVSKQIKRKRPIRAPNICFNRKIFTASYIHSHICTIDDKQI